MKYYTRLRGKILGPFSVEQLRTRARNGRFGRHFAVSTDQVSWEPASNHPELFPSENATVASGNESAPESREVAASAQEFYYAVEDEQMGPARLAELEDLIRNGRLQADTLIWTKGFSEWVALEDIPEFAPLVVPPQLTEPSQTATAHHSQLATCSLISGLLGGTVCLLVASPVAIVLGHLALARINASAGQLRGRKAAIAGLVLGYIVFVSTLVVGLVLGCLTILQDAHA